MLVDENLYVMWLNRSLNLNTKKIYLLLDCFKTASNIWNADKKELLALSGITPETVENLEKGKDCFADWCEELEKFEIEYISILDSRYPIYLSQIADPPVGLYVKGKMYDSEEIFVSMIGSRRCSEYGKNMAYKFSKALAEDGIVIVSGMASGIDSICNIGALDGGGKTIAVLGFGHNHCYPPENRQLMDRIAEEGCLISEYPPNHGSNRYTFPQRNRIIAGISEGLIVIEAGEKSGTCITVDFALEMGRTVMALPGNITNSFAKGTNDLIKQGCPMITDIEDIYFELEIEKGKKKEEVEEKVKLSLTQEERKVYQLMDNEAITIDFITKNLEMSVKDIQYILTMLELNGVIQKQPGERYIKTL